MKLGEFSSRRVSWLIAAVRLIIIDHQNRLLLHLLPFLANVPSSKIFGLS